MKKLNVLALAAVLAFGLTACGSGENGGNNAAENNAPANNTAAAENNQAKDKAAEVA